MTLRTLEYVQTPDEFVEISRVLWLRGSRRTLFTVQPLLIAAALILYLIYPTTLSIAIGLGLVLLPTVQMIIIPKATKKMAYTAHRRGQFPKTRAHIDENMLEFSDARGSESRVPWMRVREVIGYKDAPILLLGQGQYIYIPRRAFESEEDWETYLHLVTAAAQA
jgi:hypothetical protein